MDPSIANDALEGDVDMTIHAIQDSTVVEENQQPPPIQRRSKPSNKKRANGNVVRRRKHSTPAFGNTPSSSPFAGDEAKRSSSLKYFSTGYFYNDVKLSPYIPSRGEGGGGSKGKKEEGGRRTSMDQKTKRKPKGLRRTLSMPSFQKQMIKEEEDGRICEGKLCNNLPLSQRNFATKICHHTDCQTQNEMNPILLCPECDDQQHCGDSSTHLRFDLPTSTLQRKGSINSNNSDSGTEEDTDGGYRFDKKNRSYSSARRFFNIAASKNRGRLKKLQSFEQQDSSKDCFNLQFYDNEENPLDVEKVPVRKGRSLKDSIEPLLGQRGLSLDTHSVFLESSKTPLPLAFDTVPLGGNTLHVKANKAMQVDERIVELMKNADDQQDKKTQSQRQKKNTMGIDGSSTTVKSTSLPTSTSKLARKGAINGSAKDLTKSLPELLQQFSVSGFDGTSSDNLDGSQPSLIMSTDNDEALEETWTDVIDESENMTRQEKIQQEAIWELLSTEHNYVGKIRVILEVFQKCLFSLQREQFLRDIDSEKLFANIQQVYDTNYCFWNEYLKQVVEEAKKTREPIRPSQLLDSFARFEDLFDPYIRYCMEESKCVKYLKHLKDSNEHFAEYLTWCENQSQCHRLKLADLLVKPMQRVTKYALLLKAVLTRTIDTDEILSLENMISQVDRFVTKINTTLRLRHEEQKLEAVLSRLENYCPVEATEEVDKIMADYCHLNLRQKVPGLPEEEQRCILMDGSMKMIEKQGRLDVQVFLFTDVLLITKSKRNGEKFRIVRQPYRLNKVEIHPSKDYSSFIVIYLNEYGVLVTAFTLQVAASSELTKWMQAIEKAKKRYKDARTGHGSTLDFFDDDLPTSTISVPSSYTPNLSPLPDRRSMNASIGDEHGLLPSIIIKHESELPLRSSSSSNFSSSIRSRDEALETPEASVKRSMSDPKTSNHPRSRDKRSSKQHKSRPMSMIQTSDRDAVTSSWVFTGDKRNRSGSIPSDMSDDSRRSSGIGDSFRSINSDGGAPINRDSIKGSGSFSEVHSVQRLKKRFENGEYQSDSSSSLTSNGPLTDNTRPVSRSNSNKKSNPDFMEQQHTIHEEEEHAYKSPLNNVVSVHIDSDSDDDLFPGEGGDTSRTLQHDDEEGPYQNFTTLNDALQIVKLNSSTQTEINNVCEKCCDIKKTTSSDTLTVDTKEQWSSNTDLVSRVDIATLTEEKSCSDIGVQCEEVRPITRTISSQCGDFIQLSGACDTESEVDPSHNQFFYTENENVDGAGAGFSPSTTPMMDALTRSMPEKAFIAARNNRNQQRGILKSFSDANIPLLRENPQTVDVKCIHNRSQSDEPKKIDDSSSSNSPRHSVEEMPGMRALMTLSESLESTVNKRTSSGGSKQAMLSSSTPNSPTEESVEQSSVRATTPPSPSLRKLAIMNSSPLTTRKIPNVTSEIPQVTLPEENGNEHESIHRSQSEITTSSPKMVKSTSDTINKRYTWHEFDSKALLQGIHNTKYGQEQNGTKIDRTISPVPEEPRGIVRTFSKSTEQLSSPRKQKSFKKSILKKFSDSRILERDESVLTSASDTSTDSKQMKKQLDKEKKDEKKRAKMEKKLEKQEKKKYSKRRSSSHSSLASSVSSMSSNTTPAIVNS